MITMTKMTKRDYFNRILGYAHEEDKEFLLHELDLLESVKETIVSVLSDGVARTIGEICKADESLADLTSQKVSALVRQLVLEGTVAREEVKRKAYFSLA